MRKMPSLKNLSNNHYRIIPSVYPPINFFEDLVDPHEMEMVWEIESLTNERLRQETGDIFLVPLPDRVCGQGSSVVMASFTHIHHPSRFSDGSYGVYYAGLSQETAIRETVFHRENFLRATKEEPCEITMRSYVGKILKPLYDLRTPQFMALHHPENYSASQQFGKKLKEMNAWGMIYNSVRHQGGNCIAALRPPAISIPQPIMHFKYVWNGHKIAEVLALQPFLNFEYV